MTGPDDFAAMSSGDDSIDVPQDPINPDPHQPDPYDSAGFTPNDDPLGFDEVEVDDTSGTFGGDDGEPWVASLPAEPDEPIDLDLDVDVDVDVDAADLDAGNDSDVAEGDPDGDDPYVGEVSDEADESEAPEPDEPGEPDDVDALIDALSAVRDDPGAHHTMFIPSSASLAVGPDPSETAWAVTEVDATPGFVDASILRSLS